MKELRTPAPLEISHQPLKITDLPARECGEDLVHLRVALHLASVWVGHLRVSDMWGPRRAAPRVFLPPQPQPPPGPADSATYVP